MPRLGLEIGDASADAFDIGMGDAARTQGFGPEAADVRAIRATMAASLRPAREALETDGQLVRKPVPVGLISTPSFGRMASIG